jgi:hypothetical protein
MLGGPGLAIADIININPIKDNTQEGNEEIGEWGGHGGTICFVYVIRCASTGRCQPKAAAGTSRGGLTKER